MKKTIEFGRYFFKKGELQEIEWVVLNETPDGKKLLISKYCIEALQYEYEENENEDPRWENCAIRRWLNNYFINTFFTVKEKALMSPIPVELSDGTVLEDKIILLDEKQVEEYLPDETKRKAKPTPWAKRSQYGDRPYGDRLYTEKGYCTWLLRDPSKRFMGNYTGIYPDGTFDFDGADFYRGGPRGFRPVILISI